MKSRTLHRATHPHLKLVERADGSLVSSDGDESETLAATPTPQTRHHERRGQARSSYASDPNLTVEGVPTETVVNAPTLSPSARTAMLAALPDAQVVALALSGESKAFETLYRRYASFALHLATRIEGSTRDVEDIVHDAFIKAFARLKDLSDPNAFKSWLGSIVVFAVRSRLRRARLMSLLGLGRGADPVDLDSIASSSASPFVSAQLAQVYALLRTQPTDDRIAWTLRYIEGHELESVANLVGCSLATVKRRITRAQRFLEEHFVASNAKVEQSDFERKEEPLDDGEASKPHDVASSRNSAHGT
jgi:RNA polymerase sigma-70 factor, ECF subfamily